MDILWYTIGKNAGGGSGENDGLVNYVNLTGGAGLFAYTNLTEEQFATTSLPLDKLNITDGTRLFGYCGDNFTTIPSTLNLSNCTNLNYAFASCKKLESIPSNVLIGIENATILDSAFSSCESLSGDYVFDCKEATSLKYFAYCWKNMSNLTVKLHKATTLYYFASGCSNLENITLDFCDECAPKPDTSTSLNDAYCFINSNSTKLQSVTVKGLSKLANSSSSYYPLLSWDYVKTQVLNIEGFNPSSASNNNLKIYNSNAYNKDTGLKTINFKNCNFKSLTSFLTNLSTVENVTFTNCTFPEKSNLNGTFYRLNSENFDWTILDNFNLSNITYLNNTFADSSYNGYRMRDFTFSSDCTSVSTAFANSKITKLTSNIKLPDARYVSSICSGCTELVEVEEGVELATSVTESVWSSVGRWFNGCTKLKKLPRLNYNILSRGGYSNESYYYRMFYGCSSLGRIDINNLPRGRESDFENCTSLDTVVRRGIGKWTWSTKSFDNTPIVTSETTGFIYVPKATKSLYPTTGSSYNVPYSKIRCFIGLEAGETFTADPADTDVPFDSATQELVLIDLDEYLKAELDSNGDYVIQTPQEIIALDATTTSYTSDKKRETIGLFVRNK